MYSKRLIYNYVNGLDIDKDIDELENDPKFMMQVLEFTKDKNMYNLCSLEIKKNYEFVKFVIELFKDDLDFIVEVADYYLMNSRRESVNTKELIVLMNNLTAKNKRSVASTYSLRAIAFYVNELSKIHLYLRENNRIKQLDNLGLGFIFMIDEYSTSQIITDYLASKLINSIFYENENYKFEQLMHLLIKDINQFDKNRINSFLIDNIRKKDMFLAQYVSCHINLLDKVKQDIDIIEKRWDLYLDLLNERRVRIVMDYVYKYQVEKGYFINFSCYNVLDEIIKNLELEHIFERHITNFYEHSTLYEDLYDDNSLDFEKINFTKELTTFIKELFSKDVIDEYKEDYNEDKPVAKVLSTNFNKEKKNLQRKENISTI